MNYWVVVKGTLITDEEERGKERERGGGILKKECIQRSNKGRVCVCVCVCTLTDFSLDINSEWVRASPRTG